MVCLHFFIFFVYSSFLTFVFNYLASNLNELPIIFEDNTEVMEVEVDTEDQTEPSTSRMQTQLSKVQPTPLNIPLPESNKNTEFEWIMDDSIALLPIFPDANYAVCRDLEPHEQFEKFFDDELLQHICDESAKYAALREKPNPNITVNELRVFIAIFIISGYNYHSSFRCMWSQDDDLNNVLVTNSMRRNRFEEILVCLHFEDSRKCGTRDNPNPDKMWKLRPITDHIKSKMIQHFHPEQNLSYDESMIAYFGKHGCKQFIKGKPLRFGYKVWSLCTPNGYIVNFEIYQGKNPRSNPLYEEKFGKCAAPLINIIDDFPEVVKSLPFSFYFDNLFTSFPLLAFLSNGGYNGTGTIRENRIPKNCPLPHKNDLKKEQRGYSTSVSMKHTNIHLTKWVDNAVVCMASSSFGLNPKSLATRYSKVASAKINVPRPCVVTEYNKYMCGVDRFDQNLAQYRIAYRGKKWWSCIFTWLIDACIQNAWQLHRNGQSKLTQLEFRRQIAIFYCKRYGTKPKSAGAPTQQRRANQDNRVNKTLRYDRTDHFVVPSGRRRCAGDLCKVVGRTSCGKCDVGLCIECFANYHTPK